MERLTASVVGGGAGGQLSMNALLRSDCYELVAVADLREEVRTELTRVYPGVRVYPNHHEMFASSPTDVVCVSTYPPSHEEVTMDALRLPLKGILVEKPLGDTYAAGRRILEAIQARRIPMIVPHGLLVRHATREILERVRSGEIGNLQLVEIQCSGWDIINAGIHWLNFFVMLTGCEPVSAVFAMCDSSTRTYRDGMQVETMAVTYAWTRSGVRVVMQTGDYVPTSREGKPTLFRLIGSLGSIEFWGWDDSYILFNASHPAGELFTRPDDMPHHQRQLENLFRLVQDGQTDYTIPRSSLMALELCEAAYLSNRERCMVTLPLEAFVSPIAADWVPGVPYPGVGGGRDGRKLPERKA